jgi:hypothetical protein
MIIKNNTKNKMNEENNYDDEYMEYEEYETEEFLRWFYGKINIDEYDKEMDIALEEEEEMRWYCGYEKDY